jgi:hypothetical protein
MSALMEVVTLWHENSCDQVIVDLAESVKELLTKKDIDRFARLCKKGVHVDVVEYYLYGDYYEHVVNGETQVVEVSIGITSEARSWEDEATGYGELYLLDVSRRFLHLFHQMSAYVAYLESRSAQENEYFNKFMVSFLFIFACS